jgi:hypothetical protein
LSTAPVDFQGVPHLLDAGIVDQDIETAELLARRLDGCLGGSGIANIHRQGQCIVMVGFDGVLDLLETLQITRRQRHIRPGPRQAHRAPR